MCQTIVLVLVTDNLPTTLVQRLNSVGAGIPHISLELPQPTCRLPHAQLQLP